jgi:hypothetical protein
MQGSTLRWRKLAPSFIPNLQRLPKHWMDFPREAPIEVRARLPQGRLFREADMLIAAVRQLTPAEEDADLEEEGSHVARCRLASYANDLRREVLRRS